MLAAHLRRSAPGDLSETEAAALEALERAASHVTSIRLARLRVSVPALQVPRLELVASWSALSSMLRSMLSALASVPGEGPQALVAKQLLDLLFPGPMDFVSLDAAALWDFSKLGCGSGSRWRPTRVRFRCGSRSTTCRPPRASAPRSRRSTGCACRSVTRGWSEEDLHELEEESEEPSAPNSGSGSDEPSPELPDDPEINPFISA